MSLRHAVLALVAEQPLHAYGVKKRIDSAAGAFWHVTPGAVYQALEQAERRGLVTAAGGTGRRKSYAITPEGERELARWAGETESTARGLRTDLMLKLLFWPDLPDVTDADLRATIESQLLETMPRLRRVRAQLESGELPHGGSGSRSRLEALVLEAARAHLEADVAWMREAISLVSDS